MVSLVYFISSLFWGWRLQSLFRLSRNGFVSSAFAYFLGLWVSSWALFLAALATGSISGVILIIASSLMLFHGLLMKPPGPAVLRWHMDRPLLLLLLLCVIPLFFFGLLADDSGAFCITGNYDDLAFHWGMTSFFAEQQHFRLENPQSFGHPLSYHFMVNFHTALLARGGWSSWWALAMTQALNAFGLAVLLWEVLTKLQKRRGAALLALLIFSLNHEGMANILVALTGRDLGGLTAPPPGTPAGSSLLAWMNILMQNYFNFTRIFLNLLHPQRPLLVGFSLFLMVVLLCRKAWLCRKGRGAPLLATASLITGLMPFFHFHTSVISALFIITGTVLTRTRHRMPLPALMPLLLALPQLIFVMSAPRAQGFSSWGVTSMPWFRETADTGIAVINHFIFWVRAGGLIALMALPSFVIFLRRCVQRGSRGRYVTDRLILSGFSVSLLMILFINFYRFTVGWGDSNKFYLYLCFFASITISSWWSLCWRQSLWKKAAIAAFMIAFSIIPALAEFSTSILPSMLCLGRSVLWKTALTEPLLPPEKWGDWSGRFIGYRSLISSGETMTGLWIKANVPEDAVIATSDDVIHYVVPLSGRRVLDGSYTDGTGDIQGNIKEKISHAYQTGDLRAFREMGASHVAVGPQEAARYGAKAGNWASKPLFSMICRDKEFRLFSTEGSEAGAAGSEDPFQKPLLYLSDLTPLSVSQQAGTLHFDQSIEGTPLRLGGRTVEKGLGTHSHSRIVFSIEGRYDLFKALAGISEDHRDSSGSVVFLVYDDEKLLWTSPIVRAGSRPLEVKVPIRGVSLLVLEVTDAGDGDHFDHAIWGNARVERISQKTLTPH